MSNRYIVFRDEFDFVGEASSPDEVVSLIKRDEERSRLKTSLNKKLCKLILKGKMTLPEPHYSVFQEVDISK